MKIEDIKGSSIAICMRITDMPETPVPSRQVECAVCNSPLWRSLTTPPSDFDVCVECGSQLITEGEDQEFEFQALTEAQVAEVGEFLRDVLWQKK